MKVFLLAAMIALSATEGLAMDSLASLTWKNRVLILFGSAGDARLAQQVKSLQRQEAELADRDMVVIRVSGREARTLHGSASIDDADRLRKDLDVDASLFQVVLVGKDGGVKLRRDSVVSGAEIFALIDSMPMRKGERS